MSARSVNALIGRLLTDPTYLRRVSQGQTDPAEITALTAQERHDLIDLDVPALAGFAALIVKVQNNFLWEFIPYTRLIMRARGLDNTVFGAFSEIHWNLKRDRAARSKRVESFFDFLEAYLDDDPTICPALEAVSLHEITCRRMVARGFRRYGPDEQAPLHSSARAVFRPNGALRIRCYRCDPIKLMLQGHGIVGAIADVEMMPVAILYWQRQDFDEPRLFRIPSQFGHIFSRVSRGDSIEEAVSVAGAGISIDEIMTALNDLCQTGVLMPMIDPQESKGMVGKSRALDSRSRGPS